MAINILELLKTQLGEDRVQLLGKITGNDLSVTKSALNSILPAVVSGLASKGSTSQGAADLLKMISEGSYGADTLNNLSTTLAGGEGTQNALNSGKNLLNWLFGDRISKVIDWIADANGIGKASATSLLSLAGPVVLGIIGKEVQNSRLSSSGLMSLLANQAGFLKGQTPAGMDNILGLTGTPGIPATPVRSVKPVQSGFPFW